MTDLPGAFYVPHGDGFRATEMTRGPWDPGLQHAGPPAALLARAVARASGAPGAQTARITFDILRPIPIAALRVSARVLRPGRRVEQLEAVLADEGGEVLMRATAWRIRTGSSAEVAAIDPPPPPPEAATPFVLPYWRGQDVAYHRAFEWRLVSGTIDASGPACVWTRMGIALVEGEEPDPIERLLSMADAASGVSWVLPWDGWAFPNVDLSLHLERPPEGEWMAMDAVTRPGDAGVAQCTAVLSDTRGRVGTSAQTLLVEQTQQG